MKIQIEVKKLLFPEKCKCCFRMADSRNLCNSCMNKMEKLRIPDEKLPLDLNLKLVDKVYSSYYYENEAKNAIINAKFRNPASFLNSFILDVGDIIGKVIEENDIDLIISSPFYKKKLYNSEFDLPDEMAKRISKVKGINQSQCIKKIRDTAVQHKLDKEQRKANLVNAFSVTENIKGKNILLIDDVLTTGVTMSTIATELKLAGCNKVVVWTYTYNTYERNK